MFRSCQSRRYPVIFKAPDAAEHGHCLTYSSQVLKLKTSSESFTPLIGNLEPYQQTSHESCYNVRGTGSVFRLTTYN